MLERASLPPPAPPPPPWPCPLPGSPPRSLGCPAPPGPAPWPWPPGPMIFVCCTNQGQNKIKKGKTAYPLQPAPHRPQRTAPSPAQESNSLPTITPSVLYHGMSLLCARLQRRFPADLRSQQELEDQAACSTPRPYRGQHRSVHLSQPNQRLCNGMPQEQQYKQTSGN